MGPSRTHTMESWRLTRRVAEMGVRLDDSIFTRVGGCNRPVCCKSSQSRLASIYRRPENFLGRASIRSAPKYLWVRGCHIVAYARRIHVLLVYRACKFHQSTEGCR